MKTGRTAAGAFLIFIFAMACSGKGSPPGAAPNTADEAPVHAGPAWPALALLRTGENPLWFELGQDGPALIGSPETASLAPFTPWPYTRFIVGMQAWDGFLVMAVNRDGFLALGAADTQDASSGDLPAEAVLYRAADTKLWASYTAESFFIWDDKPAVLLDRNDFFIDPDSAPLKIQVYALDKSSPDPQGADIPALESYPPGWEAEEIHRGSDNFWYFRMKDRSKAQGETDYFRAEDLAGAGEKISMGEWRNSSSPESPKNMPAYLMGALLMASEFDLKEADVAKVISPDFDGSRFYTLLTAAAGSELLYVYCRETDHLVLAILPNGQGLYSNDEEPGARLFSLPVLPEGFVYTGIAAFGEILAASWEEQQDASIGAAGFMVMKVPPAGS